MIPSLSQQVAQYHLPIGGALRLTQSRWNCGVRDVSERIEKGTKDLPIRRGKRHSRTQSSVIPRVRLGKGAEKQERLTWPKLRRRHEQYSESSCFTSRARLERLPFFVGASPSVSCCFFSSRLSRLLSRSRILLASSTWAREIASLSNVALRFPLSTGVDAAGGGRGGSGGGGSGREIFGGDFGMIGFVGESCGKGDVSPSAIAPRSVVDPGGGFGVREGASWAGRVSSRNPMTRESSYFARSESSRLMCRSICHRIRCYSVGATTRNDAGCETDGFMHHDCESNFVFPCADGGTNRLGDGREDGTGDWVEFLVVGVGRRSRYLIRIRRSRRCGVLQSLQMRLQGKA